MRTFSFFLLFCCLNAAKSQSFYDLINVEPTFVDEVKFSQSTKNQLFISMPFAKEMILNPQQKKLINNRVVVKLQLVYTKYRMIESFNQKELN